MITTGIDFIRGIVGGTYGNIEALKEHLEYMIGAKFDISDTINGNNVLDAFEVEFECTKGRLKFSGYIYFYYTRNDKIYIADVSVNVNICE